MPRTPVQKAFKFRKSSKRSIDNIAEELSITLSKVTADETRVPLNQATEHYINLNRLLNEGYKVINNMTLLNDIIPDVAEEFEEQGSTAESIIRDADAEGVEMDLVGTAKIETEIYTRKAKSSGVEKTIVKDAFANVRQQCKRLFQLMGAEMGHQEVTPISVQLALIAEAYQKLEDALSKKAKTKRGEGRIEVASGTSGETRDALQTAGIKTVADIRKVKKQIQKLMTGFELLQKVPYTKGMAKSTTPFKDLIDAYNEVQGTKEFDVQVLKDKLIDTVNGKVRLELRAESRDYNLFKARYEKLLGDRADAITKGNKIPKTTQEFFDKIDIGDVTGSPAIEDKIVSDIAKIATGKKVKASNTKTTKRRKAKVGTKGKKISKSNLNRVVKASTKGKAVVAKGLKATQSKKRKTGRRQLNLAKIQIAINQKLPAEVRRNMGRPALINQTGRFSNSVRVTGLRQAPKSVVADYTYQLNPYETFENNGVRQWPTGYNPKPLISKSIRNLAAAFIDQKFTLRRV